MLYKELMEEDAKNKNDPFKTKEDKKITVAQQFEYAEIGTVKLEMHPPKEHWHQTNGITFPREKPTAFWTILSGPKRKQKKEESHG